MNPCLTNKPTLTRRLFLRTGLASLSGFYLLPMTRPLNVRAETKVKLRGEADHCIFVFLNGGASQLDTFDLKEGRWTPPDYDIRTVKPGIVLPYGQFPNLSEQVDRFAIVRSVEAWESSHSRGVYYAQVGHPFSPARQKEVPSIGAVVAYEFLSRRRPNDFLPPFVAMNFGAGSLIQEGCLPNEASPLALDMRQESPFVVPQKDKSVFDRRWQLLQQLGGGVGNASHGGAFKTYDQWAAYYNGAFQLMSSPRINQILTLNEEEHKRYGGSALGDACLVARNLLQANAGTRYIAISHNGWDLHANMFDKSAKVNHYTLCKELDDALSALGTDLLKQKTTEGKSLLDKTFIVCTGEFGRTGGDLTVNKGRDHNRMAQTVLFAGAGVQGGRAFGVTDEKGVKVVKPEWNKKRSIYTEDIVATIYSQLGIDWNKKITNTPSGRAFDYLEPVSATEFVDISEISTLFA
jgi:hypothetical protein